MVPVTTDRWYRLHRSPGVAWTKHTRMCATGEAAEGGETEAAVEKVLSGGVALLVLRGALAELPREVATLVRFLDVLRPFSFPGVGAVAQVHSTCCQGFCS